MSEVSMILQRQPSTKLGTPGRLTYGTKTLYTVEDVIREPSTGRPTDPKALAAWVSKWKIKGITAIPSGRYLVAWTYSPRFEKWTLELLNVPGFGGVRVHGGNKATDTEGCILPGLKRDPNGTDVLGSRAAVRALEDYVRPLLETATSVWLEIRNP